MSLQCHNAIVSPLCKGANQHPPIGEETWKLGSVDRMRVFAAILLPLTSPRQICGNVCQLRLTPLRPHCLPSPLSSPLLPLFLSLFFYFPFSPQFLCPLFLRFFHLLFSFHLPHPFTSSPFCLTCPPLVVPMSPSINDM